MFYKISYNIGNAIAKTLSKLKDANIKIDANDPKIGIAWYLNASMAGTKLLPFIVKIKKNKCPIWCKTSQNELIASKILVLLFVAVYFPLNYLTVFNFIE